MGQEGFEPTKLSSYELLALPVELLSQRGGFNHVTTSARGKATYELCVILLASVDTTLETAIHWCLSSKAALLIYSPPALGTKLTRPQLRSSNSLLTIEPHKSLHRELPYRSTVIVFGQSVMNALHPRWNCATPAAGVLLYTSCIEPSFRGLRESNPEVIAGPISVQGYRTCPAFSATATRKKKKGSVNINNGRRSESLYVAQGERNKPCAMVQNVRVELLFRIPNSACFRYTTFWLYAGLSRLSAPRANGGSR